MNRILLSDEPGGQAPSKIFETLVNEVVRIDCIMGSGTVKIFCDLLSR